MFILIIIIIIIAIMIIMIIIIITYDITWYNITYDTTILCHSIV